MAGLPICQEKQVQSQSHPPAISTSESRDEVKFTPHTIDEAVGYLKQRLPEAERQKLARIHPDALSHLHFGFGRFIRNDLSIWNNPMLIKNSGNLPPEQILGEITYRLWEQTRAALPQPEIERIRYFEKQVKLMRMAKPKGGDIWTIIDGINRSIVKQWPRKALFSPYTVDPAADTFFNLDVADFGKSVAGNLALILKRNRSIAFYCLLRQSDFGAETLRGPAGLHTRHRHIPLFGSVIVFLPHYECFYLSPKVPSGHHRNNLEA